MLGAIGLDLGAEPREFGVGLVQARFDGANPRSPFFGLGLAVLPFAAGLFELEAEIGDAVGEFAAAFAAALQFTFEFADGGRLEIAFRFVGGDVLSRLAQQ